MRRENEGNICNHGKKNTDKTRRTIRGKVRTYEKII